VAIVKERLTIDLRSLVHENLVLMDITYELSNPGASKHLDLLFVSGEVGVRDFEADLGGQSLRTRLLPLDESRRLWKQMPKSWHPPEHSQEIEGERAYYIFNDQPELVEVSLDPPTGQSTFHVRYRTRACGTAERPTVTWQLPYVLAPAREWGSFRQLEISVDLPGGWEARSTPSLDRQGDTLRGSFTGLPADALLLAAGPPVPRAYYWAVWLPMVLWGGLLVGGPLMCWWAGRHLRRAYASEQNAGRRKHVLTSLRRFGLVFLPALVWAGLILASVPVSIAAVRISLQGQENPAFGGAGWVAVACFTYIFIPVAILVGIAITRTTASRTRMPANS
jgi:hypothetical protein